MLKLRYETADNTVESSANYALCYSCHSRSSILDEVTSFIYHKKHIVDVRTPCNACHDPHGVSGGTITNNSHLINFDESIVNGMGVMDIKEFVDQGTNHGYCQLRCHGKGHGTGMSY